MDMAVSIPAGRRAPLAPPPGCVGSSGSRTPAPPAWRTTPCPRQSRHRWTSAGCGSGRPSPRCGLERGGRRVGQSKDSNFSQRDSIHHCNHSINQSINQRRSPLESSILPQPFTPTAHPPPPPSHSALPPPHRILTSSPTPFNSAPLPPLHPHPHPLHLVLPILPQPLNPTPMLPQDLKDLEVEVLGGGRRTHRAERRRGARGGAERRVKSQTDSADDDNWLQTPG